MSSMIVWLPEMIGTWHMLTESATYHDSHRMYHSGKACSNHETLRESSVETKMRESNNSYRKKLSRETHCLVSDTIYKKYINSNCKAWQHQGKC